MTKKEISVIRNAQSIISNGVHPDTNEPISYPFRASSNIPMALPICTGFMLAPPTVFWTIFMQTINQTYNAGLNYGNNSKKSPQTSKDIMLGFMAALGTSVPLSIGIRLMCKGMTARATGAKLLIMNVLVASSASAVGGVANNLCIRKCVLDRGIDIPHPETEESMGKSKIAAKKAVS